MSYEQHFYDNLDRGGEKMSGLKKMLIVIGSVIALATGLNLYFQYQNHQEHMQLKTSFEERDNIAVLQRLMASGKYAPDIRKAGYVIPPDGAIRLDGVIYPLEIEGELHLKISPPKKDAKDFQLFFITQVNEKQTHITFILDKNLNLIDSSYSQQNDNGKREIVSVSQSDEDYLLKSVQSEIDAFMKKMYQTLYG